MPTPAFAISSEALRSPRVLLVDDDPLARLVTGSALQQAGFLVDTVEGGHAALARLRTESFDAVIVDAMMPDLDGFDLCRQVRELPLHEHLPVLMLTGLEDDASISRAYQAGATDFLIKTAHSRLLVGRLQYMLRAAQTRRELVQSQASLARAQRLARMGSCSWFVGRGLPEGFNLSLEGRLVLGLVRTEHPTMHQVLRLIQPSDRRELIRLMRQALWQRQSVRADVGITLRNGQRRVIHLDAEPEISTLVDRVPYTCVIQDFTDRRHAEDRIRRLADFDTLTGLPNRRHILSRGEHALQASRRRGHLMALLLIDLDRFKVINDTLGHTVGDQLLVEVAARLRECVRHVDQVHEGALHTPNPRSHRQLEAVGRLGGDEFVAVLPEIASLQDVRRVAQRILEALRQPFLLVGQECFVTASVGLSVFPGDGETVVDLMRNADLAMYAVKAAGRDGAIAYDPHLSQRALERLELESALHKALERDELVMLYQPTVDASRSRVDSAEALMRWQRDGRLVMPGEFIPVAEDSGLIVSMTEWALRTVARQIARWRRDRGIEMAVSVNMPARMLSRMGLIDFIRSVTEETGVPPTQLRLEITETTLMEDVSQVLEVLAGLRQLGVEISIDDFGTGYSSLVHFTRHPVGELKIDRDFVNGLGIESRSEGVVAAVIAMAKALELKVVAEGVETLEQLRVLQRLGCHRMQGFLFAPALAAEDLAEFHDRLERLPLGPWCALAEPPSVPLPVDPNPQLAR